MASWETRKKSRDGTSGAPPTKQLATKAARKVAPPVADFETVLESDDNVKSAWHGFSNAMEDLDRRYSNRWDYTNARRCMRRKCNDQADLLEAWMACGEVKGKGKGKVWQVSNTEAAKSAFKQRLLDIASGATHSEQHIPQETDAASSAAAAADPAADKPPPLTPASSEPPAADDAPAQKAAPGAEAPEAAGAEAITGQESVGDQQQQKQQTRRGPSTGKQTARKSTGGKAPRRQLATLPPAAAGAEAVTGPEAVSDQQQQKQQTRRGRAIGKQTARKSTGGKAPRRQLATLPHAEAGAEALPPAEPAADDTLVQKAAEAAARKVATSSAPPAEDDSPGKEQTKKTAAGCV